MRLRKLNFGFSLIPAISSVPSYNLKLQTGVRKAEFQKDSNEANHQARQGRIRCPISREAVWYAIF